MKKLNLTIVLLFLIISNGYTQSITVEKVKEFELPVGYDCNAFELVENEMVVTCPNAKALFYSINDSNFEEIAYSQGRGPGELSQFPYGIAILNDYIILGDSPLQRLLIYDKEGVSFSVQRIKDQGGFVAVFTTNYDSLIITQNNDPSQLARLYNPYTKTTIQLMNFETPYTETYLANGRMEIIDDKLLFANFYGGYVSIWSISENKEIDRIQIYKNSENKPRVQGKYRFPPKREHTFGDVDIYHADQNLYYMVSIESKSEEYQANQIYVYDNLNDELVTTIEMEADIDVFEISGDYLYVHYEKLDKVVKYKIEVK